MRILKVTLIAVLTVLLLSWGGQVATGAVVLPRTWPEYFTVVVLPDTQWYSHIFPEIFREQTQWIADNQHTENIKFVIHVGDVVQEPGDTGNWDNARGAMDLLGDMPYLVVGGNHDGLCGQQPLQRCDWTEFRRYFGEPSSHALFSVGSRHFLIVGMEWYEPPYPDALYSQVTDWLDAYPEREVIYVTHAYRGLEGEWAGPNSYSQWLALENAPNLSMIVWGHFHGQRYDRQMGVQGNTIHCMLADYQDFPNGGNGWLRLLRYYDDGTVWVLTYSPWLDQFMSDDYEEGHLLETYPSNFKLFDW